MGRTRVPRVESERVVLGAEIEVERGVALPPRRNDRVHHYPWESMEVGDSFFIPIREVEGNEPPWVRDNDAARLQAAMLASARSQRHPTIKISTRKRVENGMLGVRAWRVE